jgi:hypothetical protein
MPAPRHGDRRRLTRSPIATAGQQGADRLAAVIVAAAVPVMAPFSGREDVHPGPYMLKYSLLRKSALEVPAAASSRADGCINGPVGCSG